MESVRGMNSGPSPSIRPVISITPKYTQSEAMSFTNSAQKVKHDQKLKHMRHISDNIKYDIDHPEYVVKYLTNNPIFYENIQRRKIRVIIRKRPINKSETFKNEKDIVELKGKKTLIIRLPREKTNLRGETAKFTEDYSYEFDRVYDDTTTNNIIYSDSVQNVVHLVLHEQVKTMILFYGTSHTGKSYSLFGDPGDTIRRAMPGFHMNAIQDIFEEFKTNPKFKDAKIDLSYFEVYMGKAYDLLNNRAIISVDEVKDSVNVTGVVRAEITSPEMFDTLVQNGRLTWQNSLHHPNQNGQKSFLVIELGLTLSGLQAGKLAFLEMPPNVLPQNGELQNRESRMACADLKRTFNTFTQCVRSMEESKKLAPFRACRLTTIMKDYFSGNCLLLIVGHINPAISQQNYTFDTLRYCNKIRKPPGELLTLQNARSSQVELLKDRNVEVAGELDYAAVLQDPGCLLINNANESLLLQTRTTMNQEEFARQSLFNSVKKIRRPHTASASNLNSQKKNVNKLTIEVSAFSTQKNEDQLASPGSAFFITKIDRKEKEKLRSPTREKKYAMNQRIFKANKKRQDFENFLMGGDNLVVETIDPQEELTSLRKLELGLTPEPMTSKYFERIQIMSPKRETDKSFDLEQQQIDLERKFARESSKSKRLEHSRDRHTRNLHMNDKLREKYGHLVTALVSPAKAKRDAIKIKNHFFNEVTKHSNPLILTKSEAHYEYMNNKKHVFKLYRNISGQCESEKKKNRGMKRIYKQEISTINKTYSSLKKAFHGPDEEIESRIRTDFMAEFQAKKS